jgi:hypothetical protein
VKLEYWERRLEERGQGQPPEHRVRRRVGRLVLESESVGTHGATARRHQLFIVFSFSTSKHGEPEEWKGCGQRQRSGLQSYKSFIVQTVIPRETDLGFEADAVAHERGPYAIRRKHAATEMSFEVQMSHIAHKRHRSKTETGKEIGGRLGWLL